MSNYNQSSQQQQYNNHNHQHHHQAEFQDQSPPTEEPSITIYELIDLAMDRSSIAQEMMESLGQEFVQQYVDMIKRSHLANVQVKSYVDYLNQSPNLLNGLQSELSAGEFTILKQFKPNIDAMIAEVFDELV